jgi:arginine/lysine/ornithine decarboxylase
MGHMSDIKGIADVCKKHDAVLLVDNAHGAHLKFTPKDLHPISLGAAMCCDSAHKTLPVLTGGAYVHCAKDFSRAELKSCMSMVASTSPSYLTLASLDCCNRYLSEQASADFLLLEEKHKRLTELAGQKGFGNFIQNCDSTKLSLNIYSIGTDGADFAQLLRENNIEPEYVSKSHVVLLMTPFNSKQDFDRLEKVFNHIKINSQIKTERYSPMERRRVLSPHEAYFQQSEVVKVENSEGRICAETKIICPPGIPVVACGEQIDPIAQKLLKNSGINLIKVIK